jgi:hypothetical protein
MDWFFSHAAIVTFALFGGGFAAVASWQRAREPASLASIRRWNAAAYVCMGASIVLFILAGLRGTGS